MSDIVEENVREEEVKEEVKVEINVEVEETKEEVKVEVEETKEETKEEVKVEVEETKEEAKEATIFEIIIENKENKELEINELVDITYEISFKSIVEKLLKNNEELTKFEIVLSPEIQVYFLDFCEKNPDFFVSVENSLHQIIIDNRINSRDIPELLNLIVKIYMLIKNKKQIPNVDPYDIIELMLRILFVSYMKPLVKENNVEMMNELVNQLIKIVKVAVELLRLPIIKVVKRSCFDCFGK